MKNKAQSRTLTPRALIALVMLAGCNDTGLQKKKAQDQNQNRDVIDAHFFLPDARSLSSAQGGNSADGANGLRRTNAYQVWYKTIGRCEKIEEITFVGAYAEAKRVSLKLIPSCDYNFTIALGWSDQLASKGGDNNNAASGNRIKPFGNDLRLSSDKPTYQTEIRDVIARNCFRCHNADRALGGVDISSFNKAQRAAGGSLSAIQRGTMPKGNPESMSAEDKRLFTLWVEQGTVENEPVIDPNDPDGNNNDNNDNNNNDNNNDNNNNDNNNNDQNNNDQNNNDQNNDQDAEQPQGGGNNNIGGNGQVIQTVFLQSSLLEIRSQQFDGKDEVEITDIRLKPTPAGQQAGFTSDVRTLAP